jgi:hypothetical protein
MTAFVSIKENVGGGHEGLGENQKGEGVKPKCWEPLFYTLIVRAFYDIFHLINMQSNKMRI